MNSVSCPKCKEDLDLTLASVRSIDRPFRFLLGWVPIRCENCSKRFYAAASAEYSLALEDRAQPATSVDV